MTEPSDIPPTPQVPQQPQPPIVAGPDGSASMGATNPVHDGSAGFSPHPPTNQAGGAVASGLAVKRRNPFAVWIGLPLITLGIYYFVWYYKIHKEMAEFDRRRQIPVVGPMLVLLLLGWTVIGPLISYHNAGARIRNAQRAAGLPETCSPLLCWLLAFVFSTNLLYMQFELNKVADRYPGAAPHSPVPLFV
ncbi:DUF4234 domain-containing protein [Gordonia tangerina]|uniref:DUF4234 domain-containing protein n=1 Tax=Gordonia tangerina TaxID=2911060 RepID=A0ABS9DDB2_9ACTN|nr:DUF4234 domain-containing protein [Gordonia tangerina]MCF3936986.1 DUF4234 domain-containing protein [Gordonia tangerina]